mgnify:CR=1 FL=1
MAKRLQEDLIDEIEKDLSSSVSQDAKHTILTIRNLIESNSRVEDSVNELHKTIERSNVQNEKLQRRLFYLTIVGLMLAFVQATAVIIQFR